jgi:hypothetical protein
MALLTSVGFSVKPIRRAAYPVCCYLEVNMTSTVLKQEVSHELDLLPPEDQHKVLDFARALAERRREGVSGRDLLHFAGAIEKSDLEIMRKAIEEDCERIDVNEW